MENNKKIKVCIKCTVYNHEPFLRECLDGFIMQKTDFPFIAIVHDDASTDNSAAIIREYAEKYPEIIKPIFEDENKFSKHDGSLRRIMDSAIPSEVEYVAICEGDDYWIDENKLQKQVDILDKNIDCSMVYTAFTTVDFKSRPIERPWYEKHMLRSSSGNIFAKLIDRGNFVLTCTICFRREWLFEKIYQDANLSIDYFLFLMLASHGKCIYLSDKTSAYRFNPNSLMISNKNYVREQIDIAKKKIFDYYMNGEIQRQAFIYDIVIRLNYLNYIRRKKRLLYSLFYNIYNILLLVILPIYIIYKRLIYKVGQ